MTDARMVRDVIINLKEEREEVKWWARENEIKPIHLQSARIGNPQNRILCAINPAPPLLISISSLFQIADEALDFVIPLTEHKYTSHRKAPRHYFLLALHISARRQSRT